MMSAIRNFILTFIMSLLIFGLMAYGLVKFSMSAIQIGGTTDDPVETKEETRGADNTEGEIHEDLSSLKGNTFSAIIVGTDYQPSVFNDYSSKGESESGFPIEARTIETDAIIFVHFNKETGDMVFSSIPAETRISIGGLSTTLQNLYREKGAGALADKVMALTGLPVDYYVIISAEKFKSLIDDLGGITYYVATDMKYKNEEKGLDVNLKKGSQKLNGQKALDMLRYAEYSDGRSSRRKCGVAFAKAMAKLYLTQANQESAAMLYSKYAGYFETNFTLDALSENVDLVFAYGRMNVVEYTYPGRSTGSGDSEIFNADISKATEYFSKYKYRG